MSDETLFYLLGIALVCVALIVSAVGIRDERFPGSPRLLAAVAVLVAALVGATTVFAVRNAVDEEQHREAELASEEAGAEEEQPASEQPAPQAPAGEEEEQGGGAQPAPGAQGPGGTVALAADLPRSPTTRRGSPASPARSRSTSPIPPRSSTTW
jgi:hypothetical protein